MTGTAARTWNRRRISASAVAPLLLVAGALATTSSLRAQEDPEEAAAAETPALTETERQAVARCAEARADGPDAQDAAGVILGQIVDAATREAVPEAMVWVGTAEDVGAGGWYTASEAGVFLLCGLPTGSEVHLQASTGGLLSERTVVRLTEADRVALRDLVVSNRDIAGRSAAGRVEGSVLQGFVRAAENDEPLVGASVQVIETGATTVTGDDGAFSFVGLPGGRYHLVTRYLGRTSDTVAIDLSEYAVTEVAILSLETRPIELPALRVEVQRAGRLAGFHERLERGVGDFITREDLERGDVVSNFRRLVGVRVQMGGRTGTHYTVRLARGAGLSGDCGPPLVYWNGALITGGFERDYESEGMGAFQRLQYFPRDLLEGIEVYRNAAWAPGPYRSLGDACGIILVWTR